MHVFPKRTWTVSSFTTSTRPLPFCDNKKILRRTFTVLKVILTVENNEHFHP
jgi:hypothetical protein